MEEVNARGVTQTQGIENDGHIRISLKGLVARNHGEGRMALNRRLTGRGRIILVIGDVLARAKRHYVRNFWLRKERAEGHGEKSSNKNRTVNGFHPTILQNSYDDGVRKHCILQMNSQRMDSHGSGVKKLWCIGKSETSIILSGVHPEEGGMNGVEGSPIVWLPGGLHEILRLRKTPLSLRFAPLRMTC